VRRILAALGGPIEAAPIEATDEAG